MQKQVKNIIKRSEDFAKWYTSIINEAELIQYYDIKGFMIYQPYGYEIWELIKNELDLRLKQLGSKNLYMPMLIPLSEFQKEKEHVEGFSPELFTITKIGDYELKENELVIRPTSEILFCKYWKNKLNSYKDLPFKHNQWVNVFRAEKTTKPFLRNSEFHWHELHCLFEKSNDALEFTKQILNLYSEFIADVLCIPNIKGEKTPGERFAGAESTFTIETMMQDNQALQSATSHFLGQNFTKAYDIQYQDINNKLQIPYSTSHGLSTRIIGAIIMVHADDNGLVLPFKIAPIQIAFLPLFTSKYPETLQKCNELVKKFSMYRTIVDNSDKSIGFMLSNYEIKGVPFCVIVGKNNLDQNTVTIFRRDLKQKIDINVNDLEQYIQNAQIEYQQNLYNKANEILNSNIEFVDNFDDFKKCIKNNKWVKCYFDGSIQDEKKIKELTNATPRCIIQTDAKMSKCVFTNKQTQKIVIFARAY